MGRSAGAASFFALGGIVGGRAGGRDATGDG